MNIKTKSRKLFSVLLVSAMLLSFVPLMGANYNNLLLTADAATEETDTEYYTEGIFTYIIDENGNATITRCDADASVDIDIPAELGGATVVGIDTSAFEECYNITSLTIPESVTNIGHQAFWNCYNLETINVDENNQYYSCDENGVLFNKDKIELIIFPAKNETTNYEIPDSVISIGEKAFCFAENPVDIKIPESVTNIGRQAFWNCYNLETINVDENNQYYSCDENGVLFNKDKTEIVKFPIKNKATSYEIPNSVISIGEDAFYLAENLADIKIPDTVIEIGSSAFNGCGYWYDSNNWDNGLLYIDKHLVGSNNTTGILNAEILAIKEGTLTIGGSVFHNPEFESEYALQFVQVNIPDSVKSIGEQAFFCCDRLEQVNISSNSKLTYIYDGAFRNCVGLTQISFPDSLKLVGDHSFTSCENLTAVNIGSNSALEVIEDGAFWACYKLESFYVPGKVKEIGKYAFDECKALTEVSVESNSNLAIINQGTFAECINLESFTVPAGVTEIGDYAFSNCENLSSVTFEKNSALKNIGFFAFSKCKKLKETVIPKEVINIGSSAFESCESLISVTFEEKSKLVNIGSNAFSNCIGLTDITIPKEVANISHYAFTGCYNIETICFEEDSKLENIGNFAFSGIKAKEILIPESVINIGNGAFSLTCVETIFIPKNVSFIGMCAFDNCFYLQSVTVDEDNKYYSNDENGVLYNKDKTILMLCPGFSNDTDTMVIPDSVTGIHERAFSSNHSLSKVHVPKSLTAVIPIENYNAINISNVKDVYYEGTEAEYNQIENINILFPNATIHPNAYKQNIDTPETPVVPDEPKELESIDGSEAPIKIYPENGAYDGEVFVDYKEIDLNKNEVDELEAEYARLSTNTGAKAVITYDIKVVRKDDNGEFIYADINEGKKVKVKIPAPDDYDKNKTYVILHKLSNVQNENNKLVNYIGKTTTEEINGKVYFVIDVEHFSNFTIMEVEKKPVSSISIASRPKKTSYTYKNGSLDLSGLALTVTYSDGTTETITDTSKMKVTGFDNSKTGAQAVTVEYEGCAAKFDVTVSYAWWQWIIRILLLGFLWY